LHETPTSKCSWRDLSLTTSSNLSLPTFLTFLATVLTLLTASASALALELKTDYTTITFPDKGTLHEFNDNLYLGRKLEFLLRRKRAITLEDEVAAKVDLLIVKAQEVMGMPIRNFDFRIILHRTAKEMQKEYYKTKKRKVHYKAYYSLRHNILNMGANEVSLRVFSHELGHVIIDHYFKIRPPTKIHEVLAQYCEINITN